MEPLANKVTRTKEILAVIAIDDLSVISDERSTCGSIAHMNNGS